MRPATTATSGPRRAIRPRATTPTTWARGGSTRSTRTSPTTAGSTQEQWLRADLAAHPSTACVAAVWHHPRFTSGSHSPTTSVSALWQALYDYNAEIVLVGHDHNYQRFAPQTADGARDDARGLRQFLVGTGGRALYSFTSNAPNTEVKNSTTFGVLKLTLHPASYDFEFVPIAGQSFTDAGTGIACH